MITTGEPPREARRTALRHLRRTVRDVVVAAVIFVLWQLSAGLFLLMPPRLAVFWLIAVAALFLWCHALAEGWSTARGRATERIRAIPRAAWRWIAVLAPVMSAGALAMWMVITSLHLARDRPLPRQLVEYGERPGGTLVLVMVIAGLAPLLEEFAFRGWMQRPMERRFGAPAAIGVTSVLFALAHLEPGGIAIRVAGGIALGYAVWATRSIWTGVALHMAWNLGVLAWGGIFPRFDPATRGPLLALPAALAFAACIALFAWTAPRLRAASRPKSGPLHPLPRELPESKAGW